MVKVTIQNAPRDVAKRRLRKCQTPHAGIAIAARGIGQRRTRRF
jgi:hypothetical protein